MYTDIKSKHEIALINILNELPVSPSVPIIIRIKEIVELALDIPKKPKKNGRGYLVLLEVWET